MAQNLAWFGHGLGQICHKDNSSIGLNLVRKQKNKEHSAHDAGYKRKQTDSAQITRNLPAIEIRVKMKQINTQVMFRNFAFLFETIAYDSPWYFYYGMTRSLLCPLHNQNSIFLQL